jgi:hypothetical protein
LIHASNPKEGMVLLYPADMKLGTWVHTQRIQYRKLIAGNQAVLTEEEISTMKACGDEITYRLTAERRQRLEEY